MFEQERKVSKRKGSTPQVEGAAPKAKKLNIYKVVTHFPGKEEADHEDHTTTDYVRAKTLTGAAKIVADKYVVASLATQEDLLALAKIAVIGEKVD